MNIAIANAATLNAAHVADTLVARDTDATMVVVEAGRSSDWRSEAAALEVTRSVIAARRNGASQATLRMLGAAADAWRADNGIIVA